MKIVEPSVEVWFHYPVHMDAEECYRCSGYSSYNPEEFIELAGRTCYKSEDRITSTSAPKFVRMIRERGHKSVLEHCVASARFVCDRGMTHELVRHRLASYSQESTRYCNYAKDRFEGQIAVIMPPFTCEVPSLAEDIWRDAMMQAEKAYFRLLGAGEPPEIARSVLPISLKTEIVMTANLREWRHVFELRCSEKAHPQICALMREALHIFAGRVPSVYADLEEKYHG